MAGLLDNFFGDSWDDPKSQAVMAMAQGLMAPRVAGRNSFSDALSNYTQTMSAGQEAQFKRKLQQAQIEKYGAETEKDAMMMGLLGGGSMGGAIAPPEGMNVPANVTGGQRSDPFAGVDKTALRLDYLQNGGKNMGGWVNDRTKPDMQVTGGYAYDKNKMGAGFMPSLTTSTDGKTSMIRIGPDGLPVVSAPQGAVETFGAYQGKQADFKPIKVFNPSTGREEYQTEGGVVRGAQGQQPVLRGPTPMAGPAGNVQSSGYNGGSRDSANAESIRIIASEMMNPRATAQDKAAMAREIQRLQGQSGVLPSLQPAAPQSGAYAAGPSLLEAAQAKAKETALVDTAKADVVRDTGLQADNKRFSKFAAGIDEAKSLLNSGPTASGIGALVDSGAGFLGVSSKSSNAAAKLETLASNMTMEVPRMEGPQSDGDRKEYKIAAGTVGDRTKPVSERLGALEVIERMHSKYADLNGGKTASKAETKSLQDYGYKSNDDVLRDARNTIMRNPQAKGEVEKRLKSMGLSLGGQ